jgi:phosphoribosylglycinamide formyltransferase-1
MRTAVLISGRGSNLQSLIAATRTPEHPAEIALVLSNRADAAGLDHAKRAGIACRVIDQAAFSARERAAVRAAYDAALSEALDGAGVELICLAGFMRVLSGTFVAHWRDRLINIHPSLLPAFPGLDTHERALAAGVKLHGCTVHYVREEVDSGPIIGHGAGPGGGHAGQPGGSGARRRAPALSGLPAPGRRGPRQGGRRTGRGPAWFGQRRVAGSARRLIRRRRGRRPLAGAAAAR